MTTQQTEMDEDQRIFLRGAVSAGRRPKSTSKVCSANHR